MPWQPAALVYPDVELLTCAYLRTALAARPESYAAGVTVGITVPNPRKDRMIVVRRDGGSEGEFRDQARIGLNVWATSEKDATDLARLTLALIKAMPGSMPEVVRTVQQSGPTEVPDESGQPLRYIVVEVHTRGADLL